MMSLLLKQKQQITLLPSKKENLLLQVEGNAPGSWLQKAVVNLPLLNAYIGVRNHDSDRG
jgi:hypothetical protein